MKANQSAARKVIKKLNAVRATLPAAERKVFDQLVSANAANDDVEAHAAKPTAAAQGKNNAKVPTQGKKLPKIPTGGDEMVAHAAKPTAAAQGKKIAKVPTQGKKLPKIPTGGDEMVAHAAKPTAAAQGKKIAKVNSQGKVQSVTMPIDDDVSAT